jgi:hypothetical protein
MFISIKKKRFMKKLSQYIKNWLRAPRKNRPRQRAAAYKYPKVR